MKILRYIFFTVLLPALAAGLGSCSEDIEPPVPDGIEGETPAELTLTLAVPDFATEEISSRADGSSTIRSISVLCYGAGNLNQALSVERITSGWTSAGGKIEVTVPLHKQTVNIQLVANAPENAALTGDLTKVYIDNPETGVLWGRAALKDILAKPASSRVIALLRSHAKVSASSKTSDFKITGIGVCGTASRGSIAPAELNAESNTANPASGESYGFNSGLKGAAEEVCVFETPKDASENPAARIIVRGTYKGVEGYYPVAFRTRSGSGSSDKPGSYTYSPVDVLRNHHYRLTVEGVRAEGFRSYEEARKAAPDNRLTVLITDTNDEITSITATRDYELGVGEEVEIGCAETAAKIIVVSSRPQIAGEARIELSDNSAWIMTEGVTLPSPTTVAMQSDKNATGYRYEISVPVQANATAEIREGTITVRSGELTRTITVRQLLRDYLRDPSRPVRLSIDGGNVSDDYFSWIASTVCGAGPEGFHQSGVRRDDGLNFPAVPAYTAKYYIRKQASDKSARITSGSIFSLMTEGDNYVVSMAAQSAPGITQGELTIVNGDNVTIKYPLYRTGYLHNLPASSASWQLEGGTLSGWYYYEVVYAGSRWTLDRNLGAETDKPYISTSSALKGNSGAIGAYFKIAEQKSTGSNLVIGQLALASRWALPEQSDLEAMGISTSDVTPTGSERSFVATMTTSNSKLAKVYIPHSGYYEATSLKYETHANLWTRTLVSGNQGFSQESPEYGYWFRYLDVYSAVNYSNMRLANGSSGQAPTATSVFKYMPVRPVWK